MLWVCPPEMELRPALSKIEGKDARRDFILLNSGLEEGSVTELGNGRESQANESRRYE